MKKLIYDIGMHTGEDTEFYLEKGFDVIAVEANPQLVGPAKVRFRDYIEAGQLKIIDKAITYDGEGKIKFYINKKIDDWGTVLPDWNRKMSSDYESIEVEAIQLDSIVEKYGMPYYMKVDIEGADVDCLRSLLRIGDTPDHLSAELLIPNNLFDGQVDCMEIFSYLYALGYKRFKISDQSRNMLVKCPNPPREGKYVDKTFNYKSSGLFGKELPGKAYTLDEVSKMYLSYFYSSNTKLASFFHRGRMKRFLKMALVIKKALGLPSVGSNSVFRQHGWFDVHVSKE